MLSHCFLAGLTLREAVAYPIPLLEKRLSPRNSCSKTQPRLPRTFSDILPWRDFLERSRELFNRLDDTERIYYPPVGNILPGESILSAADECEVRGAVVSLLASVNTTAKRLEIPVQCIGGGSGGSMSFTDLVVRPAGAQSNPAPEQPDLGDRRGEGRLAVPAEAGRAPGGCPA